MSWKGALAVAAGAVLSASYAGATTDAGCGVGTLIFKENTAVQQVLAATTNGTFGNQTFGITTGTLGCTSSGSLKSSKAQESFVAANFRNLSREMAAGQGEYVASLGSLLGCSESAIPSFEKFTQSNYQSLYPSADTAPTDMLKTLKGEMSKDAALSASCTL